MNPPQQDFSQFPQIGVDFGLYAGYAANQIMGIFNAIAPHLMKIFMLFIGVSIVRGMFNRFTGGGDR
jgi:hypothetical protein